MNRFRVALCHSPLFPPPKASAPPPSGPQSNAGGRCPPPCRRSSYKQLSDKFHTTFISLPIVFLRREYHHAVEESFNPVME
jgi:hypothetical protein